MTEPEHQQGNTMVRLLPEDISGWQSVGNDGLYDRDSLFDLIDGGAEVYRSLNVRAVLSRRYARKGSPEIIVDTFDMGSAADAFGAFHHDMHEGESPGVGKESERVGSNLTFWKGRYFLSLVALGDTPETRAAVTTIGKAIAGRIEEAGAPPELVTRLPRAGLDRSRLHYFHDQRLLDRYYQLGEGSPLDLDRSTEGVIARYGPTTVLIAVCYPSAKRASRAAKALSGVRCIAEARNDLLAAVCEAPSIAEARRSIRTFLTR